MRALSCETGFNALFILGERRKATAHQEKWKCQRTMAEGERKAPQVQKNGHALVRI